MEVSGQLHTLRETAPTYYIGCWMGPRAGLDVKVKVKVVPMLN
jgi:hypothetical protein